MHFESYNVYTYTWYNVYSIHDIMYNYRLIKNIYASLAFNSISRAAYWCERCSIARQIYIYTYVFMRDFSSFDIMLHLKFLRHYNFIQHCARMMPVDFSIKIITYLYLSTHIYIYTYVYVYCLQQKRCTRYDSKLKF